MPQEVINQFENGNGIIQTVSEKSPLPIASSPGGSDSFGTARVSLQSSLVGIQQQYNKHPLLYDEKLVNGATSTHLPNESSVQMDVTSTAGSRIVRQTFQYFRYQTGKGHAAKQTFVFGATTATKTVGLFDDENGIAVRYDGTTVNLLLRSKITGSVVDDLIPQSSWNVDKLSPAVAGVPDSENPSGVTLDIEFGNISTPDLEWLGTGNVRAGFNIDNKFVLVHVFKNVNSMSSVYMTTANLPLRWEMLSDGANADTMKHVCGAIDSDGGRSDEPGFPFVAESGVTSIALSTEEPILWIQPKLTFNSITNRINAEPRMFSAWAEDQACILRVYYNPVMSATPSFTDIDTATSSLEFADAAAIGAITLTSGKVIACKFIPSSSTAGNNAAPAESAADLVSKLPFTLNIDADTPHTIVVTIENTDGAAAVDVWACIEGVEVY